MNAARVASSSFVCVLVIEKTKCKEHQINVQHMKLLAEDSQPTRSTIDARELTVVDIVLNSPRYISFSPLNLDTRSTSKE